MGKIVADTYCPQCRANGGDSKGNHLLIYEDGGTYCNKCGYKEPAGTREDYMTEAPTKPVGKRMITRDTDISFVAEFPSEKLVARGIGRDIALHYGVKVEYSETTREEVAFYYPITVQGKLIAYQRRKLPKEFDRVGPSVKGMKVELFGQAACKKSGKKLLIVEGQDDVLAACQMLYRRYPSYFPNVVGMWGDTTKSISDNIEFIKGFDEVILCLDQDKVGQEAQEKVVQLLGPETKIMTISEKDPNDMLLNGKSDEFVDAFFNARKPSPPGIFEGALDKSVLLEPLKKGIMVATLPHTMQLLRGLRKAELTMILAPAGVGKTTLTKEIGYALNISGEKVTNIFLEEDLKKTQQSYIALDNNVSIARFRENPGVISEEDFNKSYDKLLHNQLWFDHWGSLDPDLVISTLRYAASCGSTFALLDHLSMVFSGTETDNERKEIDMLMTKLAAFTRESGMHLVVISHIKRQDTRKYKDQKYPYWETVASNAGRGSGALEQLADNIISIEVEIVDEDMNKGLIRTRVGKNREWGSLGVGDVLEYNHDTGRIEPVQRHVKGGY